MTRIAPTQIPSPSIPDPSPARQSAPTKGPATDCPYNRLDVSKLPNLAQELREGTRHVLWHPERRGDEWTKVPINPHTGAKAKSNDPATWGTYDETVAGYLKNLNTLYGAGRNPLYGIGRMLHADDQMIAFDHDGCLDEHGEFVPDHPAERCLSGLNSYSEISPSRTGIKTLVFAKHSLGGKTGRSKKLGKREKGRKTKAVEMFREHRFVALTGERLEQYSGNVEHRQAQVDQLYEEFFPAKQEPTSKPGTSASTPVNPTNLNDAEVILRARNAKDGDKFGRLYSGDVSGYPSPSEADAALCKLLWFWTGDKERVRRLFCLSGLGQRDHWQKTDYQERTLNFACHGDVYAPPPPRKERRSAPDQPPAQSDGASTADHTDQMQAALQDPRAKVRLPGDNWLLSQTAAELGRHLTDQSLFFRNGELVALNGTVLRIVTPQEFRTRVERHVIGYRKRKAGDNTFDINITMTNDDASGVLASPQFIERMRRIVRLNLCRQPIIRADGEIELLPDGYDIPSKTLTVPTVTYQEDMPLNEAKATIDDLYGEFDFTDGERSKAVSIAALVGMYSAQLLPEGSLRPSFIVTKNAEGAGAGTLVACAVVPVLGSVTMGAKPADEGEMGKLLATVVREGRAFVVFDNVKGHLSSAQLESFITSSMPTYRLLGSNKSITGPNLATVFITSNGCKISPDMRRRSLFVELHLKEERAEDRVFKRDLDLATLLHLRPKILAALWSFVRHWQKEGRPSPSRTHLGVKEWATVVGGIVESAGYGCPLATAQVAATADPDVDDIRTLVAAMQLGKQYKFAEIVELCRSNECFVGLTGEPEMPNAARVTFGHLLGRYDRRLVKDRLFGVEDKGHKRRYHVEPAR
jgi:primase-polymerase (primpol)-like protein